MTTLEQRFAHYHRLLAAAKGKIQILPGGGVTLDNRSALFGAIGRLSTAWHAHRVLKKKRSLLEVVLRIRYQGWGRCSQPLLVQK